MSTKAGTIGVPARPEWFPLWTAVVSGLTVAALIMSVVALGLAVRSDDRTAVPAPQEAIASGSAITGTGPGLIRLAREASTRASLSRLYSGVAVTGTGPGLNELAQDATRSAALPRGYSGSSITGSGPALVHVAFDRSVPQVTGTGPGLVQVAERTQGRR